MKKNRPAVRWRLYLGLLGILAMSIACTAISVGSAQSTNTPNSGEIQIHLEDGVVEVQDENGEQTPVASDSFFDVTTELESIDPWRVTGITLETNDSTRIEEGLHVGNLVRVQGFILEDGTWLATSIELAEEQIDPIIILIGKVDSVDPWVVNGIQLSVTEDTDIQGEIAPGMFVRVEILLLPDGTWEVLSIIPLGEPEEDVECLTVVVTVIGIEGNEIQFSGWPVVTLGEDIEIEGGLEVLGIGQVVVAVVCPSEDGQIVIVQIIVEDSGEEGVLSEGGEKVLVCHKPDKKGGHTLSIASPAVSAHLAHGDTLGPCP